MARELRFARILGEYRHKVRAYVRHSYYLVAALGYSEEDLEQEFLMVLSDAIDSYREDGGASFNSYLQTCIKRRIWTLRKRSTTQSRTAEVVYLEDEEVSSLGDGLRRDLKTTESAEVTALARLDLHSYTSVISEERWNENLPPRWKDTGATGALAQRFGLEDPSRDVDARRDGPVSVCVANAGSSAQGVRARG